MLTLFVNNKLITTDMKSVVELDALSGMLTVKKFKEKNFQFSTAPEPSAYYEGETVLGGDSLAEALENESYESSNEEETQVNLDSALQDEASSEGLSAALENYEVEDSESDDSEILEPSNNTEYTVTADGTSETVTSDDAYRPREDTLADALENENTEEQDDETRLSNALNNISTEENNND